MAVEGKLTGWLELIAASAVARGEALDLAFKQLCNENPNVERTDAVWNTDFTVPFQFQLTAWEETAPDFVEALDVELAPLLGLNEYLMFEEKVRYGARSATVRTILVTGNGTTYHDSRKWQKDLLEQAGIEVDASLSDSAEIDEG